MAKYLFTYHGGKRPDSEAEVARVMAAWGKWMGGLGAALTDGGGPCGPSKTVTANGVADNGGANPVSGYSLVEAASLEAAVDMAKGCPILEDGSVEVTEVLKM
ncbi:YciI family protein [Puniceibacterium confluentis]|uniref:YciI family protein n=1 Tax=Puniceibacterium confluentis TaxID=1958944 RepID=UPI0011B39081|nr:YciI family protein [Puniceibacterium confluentis]